MNETEIRERLRKAVGEAEYPPSLANRIQVRLTSPARIERSRTPRMLALVAAVLTVLIVAALVYVGRSQNSRQVPGVGATPSASPAASPSPTPSPTPQRASPAGLWPRATNLAYDSTRGQVILFGGTGADVTNDTWTWDGKNWTQRTPASNPSARLGAAIVDDPDHHVVLLFGGRSSNGDYKGDTWQWDGSDWKQLQPAHSPTPRAAAAITYDPVHHFAILFSGEPGLTSDTWTWNGSDWAQRIPVTAPPPGRRYGMLAFDAARGNTVLFGGFDGVNDTWTWDGNTWTQRQPTNTPTTPLEATPAPHQMVYDPVNKVVVMVNLLIHGGVTANSTMETWTWNGTTWTRLTPANSPSIRANYGLAYDAARGVTILAGGWQIGSAEANSTWAWDGLNWSMVG
jgi:hypothetical protein